jgi:hypothetical protein
MTQRLLTTIDKQMEKGMTCRQTYKETALKVVLLPA